MIYQKQKFKLNKAVAGFWIPYVIATVSFYGWLISRLIPG